MWTEQSRLAALRGYDILDTETDPIFSDFVEIAAEICGTPMALVSLVDETRQWFAAKKGVGVRETPIEQSVCAHAIRQNDVFVVPDLSLDPRFMANPLVVDNPNLRFYGGAVLKTQEGIPLGSMCVLDDKPRPLGLTQKQKWALEALSRQVVAQLELRRALRQRSEAWAENERLLAEATAHLAERDAALALKDLLMQEVHHRVKNSLSTVQSLLQLQARMTAVPDAAQQLRDSAGRIRTFGAIHEHLYRVHAAAEVDLAVYMDSLLESERSAYAGTAQDRPIVFEAQHVVWPSADAPTLGLILTELVTNSLKYGAGCITVTLAERAGELKLTVEDEGTSLPAGFEPAGSAGFGMRIVTGLLRNQQRGRLEIDRARDTTCFVAIMKRPAPAA